MAEQKPDWYWKNGLHDAVINQIAFCSLDYDYSLADPVRNYFLIELDSRNALFDTGIAAIKFYNAKVVSGDTDIVGYWWIDDELAYDGKKYTLSVRVGCRNRNGVLVIRFDDATVCRCK